MYAEKHLGGNALSMLYALTHQLPHADWSGLVLDYAYLAGANLEDKSFRGSSMKYANLDNTQLGGADFRKADLTGVQLKETAPVLDLALDRDRNAIYVGYGDNTVRRWLLGPGGHATSHIICEVPFTLRELDISPFGDLIARGNQHLAIISRSNRGKSWNVVSRFRVRADIRGISVQAGHILLQRDLRGPGFMLHSYAPQNRETPTSLAVDHPGPFCLVSPSVALISAEGGRLALRLAAGDDAQVAKILDVPPMSCIDAKVLDKRGLLVVLGHGNGDVSLWRVRSDEPSLSVEQIWRIPVHGGFVTTVRLSDSFVISGGVDRAVCLLTFTDQWRVGEPLRLHRTLSCKGMKIDGVKGERERQLLRSLIESD
jgi:hypothetical protein